MMWGTWLFWILVGGLVLFLFNRGGCSGHAGHGGSRDDGGRGAPRRSVGDAKEGESSGRLGRGGCH